MEGLPDEPLTNMKGDRAVHKCVVCEREFMRFWHVNPRAVTCSVECRRKHHLHSKQIYNVKYRQTHRPQPKSIRVPYQKYVALLTELEELRARVANMSSGNDQKTAPPKF